MPWIRAESSGNLNGRRIFAVSAMRLTILSPMVKWITSLLTAEVRVLPMSGPVAKGSPASLAWQMKNL